MSFKNKYPNSKCDSCASIPLKQNLIKFFEKNEKNIKISKFKNNNYKDGYFNSLENSTVKKDIHIDILKKDINLLRKMSDINMKKLTIGKGNYTLNNIFIRLHTSQFLMKYYNCLHKEIGKKNFNKYCHVFNNKINNFGSEINNNVNSNRYDINLMNKPDCSISMPINRWISYSIKNTKGVNMSINTFRYSNKSINNYMDLNNNYYSFTPLSTSTDFRSIWFHSLYNYNQSDFKYKYIFHLDETWYNTTAEITYNSFSGINEKEILISPHIKFKKISEYETEIEMKNIYNFINENQEIRKNYHKKLKIQEIHLKPMNKMYNHVKCDECLNNEFIYEFEDKYKENYHLVERLLKNYIVFMDNEFF